MRLYRGEAATRQAVSPEAAIPVQAIPDLPWLPEQDMSTPRVPVEQTMFEPDWTGGSFNTSAFVDGLVARSGSVPR